MALPTNYVNPIIHERGLNYLRDNARKIVMVNATLDSFGDITTNRKLAESDLTSANFSIDDGDSLEKGDRKITMDSFEDDTGVKRSGNPVAMAIVSASKILIYVLTRADSRAVDISAGADITWGELTYNSGNTTRI